MAGRLAKKEIPMLTLTLLAAMAAIQFTPNVPTANIIIPSTTVTVGQHALVPVVIGNYPSIIGIELEISISSNAKFVNYQRSALAAACITQANITPKRAYIAIACPSGLSGDGLLLTMEVEGRSAGPAQVKVERCVIDEDAVRCVIQNGAVVVRP